MTDSVISARLLDVALNLDISAAALREDIRTIKQDERRRRVQFLILALSVVIDLLLSGGLFYALHTTSDSQHRISETLFANCQSINDEHRRQLQLWDGLIVLAKTPGEKPASQKTMDQFNQLLAKTFSIKDCSKIH